MKISELAKQSGVSRYTIRYYEQLGMIKGGTLAAGTKLYGEYDQAVLDTILMIKQLQGLGFTLSELKDYMHDYRFIKNDEPEIQRVMGNKIHELRRKKELLDQVIGTMEFRLKHGRYPDDRNRLIS
jgi:DNA-binding transcriptional MerR regulator